MRWLSVCILTLGLSMGSVVYAQPADVLNEDVVREFLDRARDVFNQRDTLALQPLFWDDAKLVEIVDGREARTTLLVDYLMLIQEAWDNLDIYEYDFEVSHIEIVGSQAIVTGAVKESFMTKTSLLQHTNIEERDILEWKNGELRFQIMEVYPQSRRANSL